MTSTADAAATLDAIGGRINLVFHDLADDVDPTTSRYAVTLGRFDAIVDWLGRTGLDRFSRLYFDDNHKSVHSHIVGRGDLDSFEDVVIAVPAVSVTEPGCGDWDDLDRAKRLGCTIAAHGYQHVRLASYRDGVLLDTPLGGSYQPVGPGHRPNDVLPENEVLYQLVEAREALARAEPTEFVLPYGCFNRTTCALNERLGLYPTLATADFDLDIGQALRPRLLIEATTTVEELESTLLRRIGKSR